MFGNYFYNETIRKTVIAFGTLFNNISVKHTQGDTTISTIKVPIAYGPIQKFLARVEQQPNFDRNAAITLPRLSFEITNTTLAEKQHRLQNFVLFLTAAKIKLKEFLCRSHMILGSV